MANHLSYLRNFLGESFDVLYLDNIFITSEVHHLKTTEEFYLHILNSFNINPNELLLIDKNSETLKIANNLGINLEQSLEEVNIFKYLK